jgi:hypothetical protein
MVGPAPQEAFDTCGQIGDATVKSDCFGALGQVVGADEPEIAERACKRAAAGVARFECYFRLAEQTRDIEVCHKSGPFVRPCSHHLWSDALPALLWGSNWEDKPADTRRMLSPIGGFELQLELEIVAISLDPTDESYWDLAYRTVFLQQCPVNLELCISDAPELLKKSCVRGARRAVDANESKVSGSEKGCTLLLGRQLGEDFLTNKTW